MSNKPQIRYDTTAINQVIPIAEAIERYTDKSVSTISKKIRCLSPQHKDQNPSASICKQGNYCKCFSCLEVFRPIDLAVQYYNNEPFPAICQRILEDFGFDPHNFSNLSEVEEYNNKKYNNEWFDSCPVDTEELNFIGLYDIKEREELLTFKASEYYKAVAETDDIPYEEISHNRIYDKDGNERIISIPNGEANYLGLPCRYDCEGNVPYHYYPYRANNIPVPTLYSLWRDNKKEAEEMFVLHAEEKITQIKEQKNLANWGIVAYEKTHTPQDIKNAEALRKDYIQERTSKKDIVLTIPQKEIIESLYRYEQHKDTILRCEEELITAQQIIDKILAHQEQRAVHEKAMRRKAEWQKE